MKASLKHGVLLLAIAIIGIGGLVLFGGEDSAPSSTRVSVEQEEVAVESDSQAGEISYEGVPDETALATLRRIAQVETETGEFGDFVTAIDGQSADASSEHWAFYVNGELASVGAGSYVSNPGDMIEWKLEQF